MIRTVYAIEMREPGKPSAYVLDTHGQWFTSKVHAETYIKGMHPTMHLSNRVYIIKAVTIGRHGSEIQS